MVGQTISHYRILEKLGEGGMGVVYKAEDTQLERPVALKFLSPHLVSNSEVRERFIREARTAAALDHPNICTVFEIVEAEGHTFIAMACLEGRELADEIAEGPLDPVRTVELALQFAEGLSLAHTKGVVHRDIKPANLFVTSDGRGIVLDFGLAQLASTDAKLTCEGTTLGTCAYMSPEQASGADVDRRTDVWALGCVVYEMLGGQPAFRGHFEQAIVYSILNEAPEARSDLRQDVPAELEQLVDKCLSKQAAERFSSGTELGNELRRVKQVLTSGSHRPPSGSRDAVPSVAVLPFENRGRDEDDEYLSDGIAEEIINALTKLDGLRVAARSSAFHFKGKGAPLREVAEKLNVGSIVEGTVRRSGERLRVTAQLVDVADGYQVWSERYDRVMEDIFDVQDEISLAIVEQLKIKLIGGERLVTKPTTNDKAYELYLKGRHYWHQRSPPTLRVAMRCFEQAIKLDPQYALAYAGLADCYGILRGYGWISAEDGRPPAHTAMTKAMALAPLLWEVNFSRGFYQFFFERDWRQTGDYFAKAVVINPRSSLAQAYYGLFLVMEGQADQAILHMKLALEADPLSPFIRGLAGAGYQILGHFGAAESEARQALELQPDYLLGVWILGLALSGLGRTEDSIEILERAATLSRAPTFLGALGLNYARDGRLEAAAELLRELEDRGDPAFARLPIYVGQGDLEAIRSTLSEILAESTPTFSLYLSCGPFLEEFRNDPEVDRLLVEFLGR